MKSDAASRCLGQSVDFVRKFLEALELGAFGRESVTTKLSLEESGHPLWHFRLFQSGKEDDVLEVIARIFAEIV